MNNTIRNSFASIDLLSVFFNLYENFLLKWKESLVLSEFHNVQRSHALSRQKLEEHLVSSWLLILQFTLFFCQVTQSAGPPVVSILHFPKFPITPASQSSVLSCLGVTIRQSSNSHHSKYRHSTIVKAYKEWKTVRGGRSLRNGNGLKEALDRVVSLIY